MALSQPWTAPLAGPLIPGSPYAVVVLQEGYSRGLPDGSSQADGTVSLVLGPHLTLVDTGGPWGRERLLASLARQGVSPGDIRHVVCTHGHSDHVGNLNLFPRADLTVGTDFSQPGGRYLPTGLRQGAPFLLDAGRLEVLPTPGHTGHDVSLLVRGTALGDVLLAGDLFEREADEGEWQRLSEAPGRQAESRARALGLADVIVPGHGPPFRILVPAVHIQATGQRGCCGNRCGMFLSVLFAAVGLLGAGYALAVSVPGLVHGPLCKYLPANGTLSEWGRPFQTGEGALDFSEESYLFDTRRWDTCQEPPGVTQFNVILFSLILGAGGVEAALCFIQVFNGLLGCLCGTCNEEKTPPAPQTYN
ncbi:metallo-beta-lactamase domain-containing protein 1 [Hemicordylus capensis]|uniref:metallo-beta-lactamase domain-containing protein 1 n=1 Tax=Hemicordylus capensis TaxID=884348 RepID=UPI0023039CC7|nr:metallo-beta-lactamase domain-containing protein 1 [Hemicordylus capensis]